MKTMEILIVIVPAARREEVVDLFMGLDAVGGFTRTSAAGFSREHGHFSLAEAVQGFENQERFEVVLEPALLEELLSALEAIAGRDRFFYWHLPVASHGRIGSGPR